MIAAKGSSASTRSSSMLWLACGLLLVVACSNQITYSRIGVELPDSGPGTGGATSPGIGGKGAGGSGGAGAGGAGGASADAGADVPIGSGGAGMGGMGTGAAGTGGSGMGGMGTGGSGMGGTGTGGSGMGGMGTGGAPLIDNAQFNFEASAQGWVAGGAFTGAARMTAQRFAGAASLGATLTYAPAGGEMTPELSIFSAAGTGPVAGDVVTFHVFLPADAAGVIPWVQPYLQDNANPQAFIAMYTPATTLIYGGWTTITLPPVPANIVPPIVRIAVQVHTAGTVAFTGTIYVDSISW